MPTIISTGSTTARSYGYLAGGAPVIIYNTFTGFSNPINLPTAVSSASFGGFAYSPTLGRYAVAYAQRSSWSTDAVTWAASNNSAAGPNLAIQTMIWNSVTNQFVAFGCDASNTHSFFITSTDGASWSLQTYFATTDAFSPVKVIFNPSSNTYVVAGTSVYSGTNGYMKVATSTNGGATWTIVQLSNTNNNNIYQGFDYSPSTTAKYVITSNYQSGPWTAYWSSTDGITWPAGTSGTALGVVGNYRAQDVLWMPAYNQWMMMTYANSTGYAYFYLSTDGQTFTGPTQQTGPTTYYGRVISTLKGEVVAFAGTSTGFGYSKFNGTNFSSTTTFTTISLSPQGLWPLPYVNTPTGNVIALISDNSGNGRSYLFTSY